MCGIAGFLDVGEVRCVDDLRLTAEAMVERLRHRGPDAAGVWVDPQVGAVLGHSRLAVLDPSPSGSQPMVSCDGRYVLVHNGQIYNFREIRRDLEKEGEVFRGRSDTEVALAAFARWGIERALACFNGMFALALWDRRGRTLHLMRDRLGEKPLYYGWIGSTLIFASQLRSLFAHSQCRPCISREALSLFVRFGYVPAPWSIFEGICKLPAGTRLEVRFGSIGERPDPVAYWSARNAALLGSSTPLSDPEEALAELGVLLDDSVRLRMIADVPLGAFLSGGVDSSTIVALMCRHSLGPVKTFSIGFREGGYDECQFAAAVARHLGAEHSEFPATEASALSVIPRLGAIYDEPFADSSQIPTVLLAEMTRRCVTVVLGGDGGDELFSGYDRYRWGVKSWRAAVRVPPLLRRTAARGLMAAEPDTWNRLFALFRPVEGARLTRPGEKLHKLADALRMQDPGNLYHWSHSLWRDPAGTLVTPSEPVGWLEELRVDGLDESRQLMLMDTLVYLPDDLLVKIDRAAMAFGLETRVPLLDHRLLEFAWRVRPSLHVGRGGGKWLLKQLLNGFVPESLVARPKQGFAVPLGAWLKGALRDWAESVLDEGRLKRDGYFRHEPILFRWKQHLEAHRDWSASLWCVLMFGAWLDEYRTWK